MRIATIVRAMLLFAFVFALFVWAAVPSPVAAACPPGLIEQFVFNERTRQEEIVCGLPPQDVVVNPPAANPPVNSLPPTEPSKWDLSPRTTWPVGSGGGTFYGPGGGTTVTVPRDLFPDGTLFTFVIPPLNGLRPGALVLRGDGDHIINIGAADPNDFTVREFLGMILVCFEVENWEVQQSGQYNMGATLKL